MVFHFCATAAQQSASVVYAATMRHTGMIDFQPSASLTITLMAVPVAQFSSSGSEVVMVGAEHVPNFVKKLQSKTHSSNHL